jgi:hypothetical protein
MSLLSTISFLALAIFAFAASPLGEASTDTVFIPSEEAEKNRRGVAFNNEKLPHLFMGSNNKIGWMYNW